MPIRKRLIRFGAWLTTLALLSFTIAWFMPTDTTISPDLQPRWPANLWWNPPALASLPYAQSPPRPTAQYAVVGSRPDPNDPLGPAPASRNKPIRIPENITSTQPISLHVTNEPAIFNKNAKGVRVYVLNNQNSEASFSSIGNALHVHQEALDPDGNWRRIETPASSSCGNSYWNVFLPGHRAWRINAPRYDGPFKTKLRFALDTREGNTHSHIYSNEFDSGIDPEIFKIDYTKLTPIPSDFYGSPYGCIKPTTKPIPTPSHAQAKPGQLTLSTTDEPQAYAEYRQGICLYLTNATDANSSLPTIDGRLTIYQQARDENGMWRSFEAWPTLPAGSSGSIQLATDHTLRLAAPKYTGDFKTKLRFVLILPATDTAAQSIYSNEFDGSVSSFMLKMIQLTEINTHVKHQ